MGRRERSLGGGRWAARIDGKPLTLLPQGYLYPLVLWGKLRPLEALESLKGGKKGGKHSHPYPYLASSSSSTPR